MESDQASREMVRIIISLAHNFRLRVVAEGVETQAQAEQLQRLGCELAQGYLYSRPIAADAVPNALGQARHEKAAPVGI